MAATIEHNIFIIMEFIDNNLDINRHRLEVGLWDDTPTYYAVIQDDKWIYGENSYGSFSVEDALEELVSELSLSGVVFFDPNIPSRHLTSEEIEQATQ